MAKKTPLAREFQSDPELDPRAFAQELVDKVLAGTKKVFDVRRIVIAIKNPSIRLKVDYEFRRRMRETHREFKGLTVGRHIPNPYITCGQNLILSMNDHPFALSKKTYKLSATTP